MSITEDKGVEVRTEVASSDAQSQLWQEFVETHSACSNYHRWGWKRVIEETFHWPTFYLIAHSGNRVEGILPLVWQKSRMFGSFLTSVPFLNGGGIVADTTEGKNALVAEAVALAKRLRVRYVELRHRGDPQLDLPTKTHKVAMLLPVQQDTEKMFAALPHKVRTDIRKGMKSGLTADFGGQELLDDFYAVFARNMRDLGTPVYSRSFFANMLAVFPQDNFICVVRHQGEPVAASFLIGYRGTVEAGWSSSRYDYLSMRPNMFLYWQILCFAARRGFHEFDFGRSSIGSGTHRFKQQWGSPELPLYWSYWVPEGEELPEVNKENPRYDLAIRRTEGCSTQKTSPRSSKGFRLWRCGSRFGHKGTIIFGGEAAPSACSIELLTALQQCTIFSRPSVTLRVAFRVSMTNFACLTIPS